MKFKGLLGDVLGYIVIRGFAKLEDLKKYSAPKDYQRSTLPTHIEDIKKFYSAGDDLFFPEIILSLELNYDFTKKTSYSPQLTRDIWNGKNFYSNVDGINVKQLKPKYEGDVTIIANVFIPDEKVGILGRIDGNHRLEAFNTVEHFEKTVPFCIVLFDPDKIDRQEKVLFHNINSKAEPLKNEEIFSSIILDYENFPDKSLKSKFGIEYLLSRQINQIDLKNVTPLIYQQLNGQLTSAFIKLFDLLKIKGININDLQTNDIVESIRNIESLYRTNNELNNIINTSVCITMFFYQIYQHTKLPLFLKWINKNYFVELPEVSPDTIIKIFENLTVKRTLKVFVAMPYWSHAHVNEYNKLFKEALSEISENGATFYELFPIMRHRGASQRIDQRLLKQIATCDIFVADLTGINQNVLYETAYAEGLDKPSLLIRAEEDEKEKKLPFDMTQRQYVPYPKGAYYNKIKDILKNNLPTLIDEHYKIKRAES